MEAENTILEAVKNVLILSYFFPPCNLTAGQRTYGWAKYFTQFGYYPTVVTRNWDIEINDRIDLVRSTGDHLRVEKNDSFEVHYLPYRANWRDRLLTQRGRSKMVLLFGKFLTLLELVLQNFTSRVVPFNEILTHADGLIANRNFDAIVVTGNPFILFQFADKLSRKHNIPWIADYRDDWNTGEVSYPKTWIEKQLKKLEGLSEKRWLRSSSAFTTISPHYRDKIAAFIGKKGYVILNGFFSDDFIGIEPNQTEDLFILLYNGTLYPKQDVEGLCRAFKRLIKENNFDKRIQLRFLGLGFDPFQTKRVQDQLEGYESFFEITLRMPRKILLEQEVNADVLIMLSHAGLKGVPSSKLYEYLAVGRPIIAFPNDQDIIESTIRDYKLGRVADNENELLRHFQDVFDAWKERRTEGDVDESYVAQFTRDKQTGKLGELLDQITSRYV